MLPGGLRGSGGFIRRLNLLTLNRSNLFSLQVQIDQYIDLVRTQVNTTMAKYVTSLHGCLCVCACVDILVCLYVYIYMFMCTNCKFLLEVHKMFSTHMCTCTCMCTYVLTASAVIGQTVFFSPPGCKRNFLRP